MKSRNGFVSNSSSSSFVVATKNKGDNMNSKVKFIIEVDLSDYVDKSISTLEELIAHYQKWGGEIPNKGDWNWKEWCAPKKAIEEGKIVHFGSFCDETEPEEYMLCHRGLNDIESDDVEVIFSEAGY